MTKREMYAMIATVNADNAEIVDFCNKEIALLDARKASKSHTKTQKANEGIMDTIEAAMTALGKPATVTEILSSDERLVGLTNQKVSALLRKMVEAGRAVKSIEGKKALFEVA